MVGTITPMMAMQAASAAVSLVGGVMRARQASAAAKAQSNQAIYAAQVERNNRIYASQQAEYSRLVALNQASVTRTNSITQVARSKRKANERLHDLISGLASASATAASRGLAGLQVEREVLGQGLSDVYGERENSIFAQLEGEYQAQLFESEAALRGNEARYNLALADAALQSGEYGARSTEVAGQFAARNALISGATSAAGHIGTGIYRQQQLGTPSGFTSTRPRPVAASYTYL